MPSEAPSTPLPQGRPAKRPRVLVACQRCKTRRQKCDNASPACSNCSRSGTKCLYSDQAAYPPSYVKALEERVRQLEAKVATAPEQESTAAQASAALPYSTPTGTEEDTTAAEDASSSRLVNGMGLLSSCAAAEPHYFGFSAGLSLAHFVQVAVDFGSSSSDISLPLLTDRPFSNQALTADTTPASLPSPQTGAAFIRAYLVVIHPLYPFLHRASLWRLHKQRTRGAAGRNTSRNFGPPGQPDQMDDALLHLVYAIGSRCLQLLDNQKITKNAPEGHFLRAMQIIGGGGLKFTSIRSIELTLLLAIHSMRSPSGTSVWHLAGLAIRQCIELGLHKQRAVNAQTILVDQHKKRLFWSAYIFERKTALVLGRPFALSDQEIDVHLPLNVDDDEDDSQLLVVVNDSGDGDVARASMSFHRAHVELYQLHTQIRMALYHLKRAADKEHLQSTIASLFSQLDAWKAKVLCIFDEKNSAKRVYGEGDAAGESTSDNSSIVGGHARANITSFADEGDSDANSSGTESAFSRPRSMEVDRTELLLEFYKARRSLLQPLMTEGQSVCPFDAGDYLACADASGQICQLYRRLHRLSPVPFSLRDLHAIFVAGFTLIYSICSCPQIYSPQRARDIGACSTLLYVITEQWASAKKYRDAFEVVAEKMEESAARLRPARRKHARTSGHVGHDATIVANGVRELNGSEDQLSTMLDSPAAPAEGRIDFSPFGAVASRAGTSENASPMDRYTFVGPAAGIELDLEADMYGIEGLLYSEGLDWFTEAVF